MSKSSQVYRLYQRLEGLPAGRWLFSRLFSMKAPYFGTIGARFTSIEPNFCELTIRKRRKVQNHIGTVHVIAICNGLEMAMGALAETTIPDHLRWIPKGMEVRYPAKADTDLRIQASTRAEDWVEGEVPVTVKALRADDTVVVEGTIFLHVSEKKRR
ncbi:hotdog fold domain-containing protein [Wenzhouxiangella marina]|uniref:Thioesterase n=1 Tax=Wenzhouxiangella marina TaxID=1579979 RepID=A0A0K0XV57_9GAMM|nr:hotdog fold domain-containing protein [Wenzhouxiangella marina]AKS41594.1 Thioesterase [Wenzhouxiangella marina]MBB6086647.1 acyl-coenzyme A thioesterase PaaI-like protein [Wenzhouxiangella marina]